MIRDELVLGDVKLESKEDFQSYPVPGYSVKAFEITFPETLKKDYLVQIFKEGELKKEFLFPAYKIWNIPAHMEDIVSSLEEGNDEGLLMSGSTGLGGNVYTPMNTENVHE